MTMNTYRHLVSLALLLGVLFLPYWLYVPAILAGVLLLPFYWEAIVLGFLIDTLYGTQSYYPGALLAALAVGLLLPIRERLRLTR
jgi:hypothetical protein